MLLNGVEIESVNTSLEICLPQRKKNPQGTSCGQSKTFKCAPLPLRASPPPSCFFTLAWHLFFFASALLIEVRHHAEAAFHLCLSHSILLSCSCTRLRSQVDGGLNQTVVKFRKKKKKRNQRKERNPAWVHSVPRLMNTTHCTTSQSFCRGRGWVS